MNGVSIFTYDLFVDYTRSVEEMVKAGAYYTWNKDINSNSYPISSDKIGTKEHLSASLFCFHRYIKAEQAIEMMVENKSRTATAHELLAFGEKYPSLQMRAPIIALGSTWWGSIANYVLILDSNGVWRELLVIEFNRMFARDFRFLGINNLPLKPK